jgi:2-hydroxy-6-oxonona-2,4-dienedioate hydrolase
MVWRIWGDGPVLLLLHGNHGSWRHWARNVLDLAQRFTVIAPDMPANGESDPLPEPCSLDEIVATLRGGFDSLIGGETPFTLMSFSFGGLMAGEIARLSGARVRRLVLVGPGGLGLPQGPREELVRWRQLPDRAAREAAHRRNLEILMIHAPAAVDALAVHIQAFGAESYKLWERPRMGPAPLRDALPQIACPVSAVWGSEDRAAGSFLEARREALAALRPDAPQFLIEGAGHWVQYEKADRFNALMREILV